MKIRKAILDYQFSERLKSELIIASKLTTELTIMKEEELTGAVKIFSLFLDAVSAETRIAYNVSKSDDFLEADEKISEAIREVKIQEYETANKRIAQALSLVTNTAGKAMQTLIENRLI